jgi:hypothetical protein
LNLVLEEFANKMAHRWFIWIKNWLTRML